MAYRKLSELLPVDDRQDASSSYNAYEVFGIDLGETDDSKIGERINETIARLKAKKSKSEPAVWSTAAKLAQASRIVLLDPAKKKKLDAQLGIVKMGAAKQTGNADPLASLLPATDPLAAVLPPVTPKARTPDPKKPQRESQNKAAMPAGLFQGPAVTDEGSPIMRNVDDVPQANSPSQVSPQPIVSTQPNQPAVPQLRGSTRPRMRRKKSVLGPIMLGVFTLALMGIIGVLVHFMYFKEGTLAISSSGNGITISTAPPPAQTPTKVNPPTGSEPLPPTTSQRTLRPPPRDPVMGGLAGNVPPPTTPPPSSTPPSSTPGTPRPTVNATTETAPREPTPAPMTEATKRIADQRLAEIRSFIKAGDWAAMKAFSESNMEVAMSPEQRDQASALQDVAELAAFYRNAIVTRIPMLNAGEDLAVTANNRYVIVGTRGGELTVQANGRQKTFSLDEMPMGLMHKIASLHFAEGTLLTACRATYQAVCPQATMKQRANGIKKLREMTESPEETDTRAMALAIEDIWSGSSE